MTGPMIYGHVLRYQMTGTIRADVPAAVACVLPQLAEMPEVLTYLRQHYPGSKRQAAYRAVARAVCQELCAQEEAARQEE